MYGRAGEAVHEDGAEADRQVLTSERTVDDAMAPISSKPKARQANRRDGGLTEYGVLIVRQKTDRFLAWPSLGRGFLANVVRLMISVQTERDRIHVSIITDRPPWMVPRMTYQAVNSLLPPP